MKSDHVARTVSEQPPLFWYIDSIPEPGIRLIFALLDEESVEPISEITLTVTKSGVQRISLAEQGVKLEPGVEYEWSVALVLDPEQRSRDIIASGWAIRVEDAPADLGGKPSTDLVMAYAEAGLWYDALATISELIDENPDDKSLRQIRAGLLRQVGFQNVAYYFNAFFTQIGTAAAGFGTGIGDAIDDAGDAGVMNCASARRRLAGVIAGFERYIERRAARASVG